MNDVGLEPISPRWAEPGVPLLATHSEIGHARLNWGRRFIWTGRACLILFAAVALISGNRAAGLLTFGAVTHFTSPVWGGVELGVVFVLVPAGLAFWLLGLLVTRAAPTRSLGWRIGPPAVIVPLSVLVALTLAHLSPAIGWSDFAFVLGALGLLGVAYLFVLNDGPSGPAIAGFFALTGSLQALVGVGQFVVQHDLGLSWLGELSLDPRVSGISVLGNSVRILRAYGLMRHPNALGAILPLSFLAAISLCSRADKRRRFLWLGSIAVNSAGLLLSFSRTGWLAALAGGAVLLAASGWPSNRACRSMPRHAWVTWAPAGLAVGLVVVMAVGLRPELFRGRLFGAFGVFGAGSHLEYWSIFGRLDGIHSAWDVIRRWPLWGVGTGRYVMVAARLAGISPSESLLVDSTPLVLWAEQGLAAPVVWLGMGAWQVWLGCRRTAGCATDPDLALATAWVAAVQVVCLFEAFFWPSHELWQGAIWLGVALGLWSRAAANSAWRSAVAEPGARRRSPDWPARLRDSSQHVRAIVRRARIRGPG